MSDIVTQHPPGTPQRIDLPGPDQIPEIDQDPTVPPTIIEEPEPSPRQPDEGDIDRDPRDDPRTHGDEGSP